MRALSNPGRVARLIDEAIQALALDLSGLTVLTEIGTGAFVTTPLIAARAGAREVFAVCRDSSYGSLNDVVAHGSRWAAQLEVSSRIVFSGDRPHAFASRSDIVTNLGFVRPIDRKFVAALPPGAAVALMWEPWEFRSADIDAAACREFDVPIIGTRETDPRLRTFDYVGALTGKLLLENDIELLGSRVVLIGSDPFGASALKFLKAAGAQVERIVLPADPTANLDHAFGALVQGADALVLLEHRDTRELVGTATGIRPQRLARAAVSVVHICGRVDDEAMARHQLAKRPARRVSHGTMTVTTEYLGPKPVINLHGAGLRVAAAAVRVRRQGGSTAEAIHAAQATGLGLALEDDSIIHALET